MTIIVKKYGKMAEYRQRDATCNNCGTEFEFSGADARIVHDARDGNAYVLPCPVCRRECWIDAGLPPRD